MPEMFPPFPISTDVKRTSPFYYYLSCLLTSPTKTCLLMFAHISISQVLLFFNSKDRDRDGRISYEEFCDRETVNERAFKAMDLNNDGFITKVKERSKVFSQIFLEEN